jgi:hypothetical protein
MGSGAVLHEGPGEGRKPINARSETVARSPLFKEAFARRRCLVPAAAYYEWRHDPSGKTPFAIARQDGEPVALGGMWKEWRSEGETLRTFATRQCRAASACRIASAASWACRRLDWLPGLFRDACSRSSSRMTAPC